MKVGIVGFGKMGQIRAEAVENCGGTVIGIFDTDIKVTESKYKIYDTVDELFIDEEIDSVFICTPNFLNAPYTIKALNSGKNVFCEKPPAKTTKELEGVLEAEKNSDKKLMYGFNHRHHQSIIKVKEIVDSGDYGKILWMRGRYGKNVNKDYFQNWRADKELSGGGILIDQGIHMLDLFVYMAGDFDKIQSTVSNQYWKIEGIEDNVFSILESTKSGVVASLHSTMTQWRHLFSFEIFLEHGYMTLNGLKTPSGSYGEEVLTLAQNDKQGHRDSEEIIRYNTDHSWDNEVNQFFDFIKNDKPVDIGNSNDAMKIMKIIERIYE